MRKEYTPDELSEEQPDVFKIIKEAAQMVVPNVLDHVHATLKNEPISTVAEHASFIRIGNDEKILYVQLRIHFWRIHNAIDCLLKKIVFHETEEDYDRERDKIGKQSEKKFGKDLGVSNYDGKRIGEII